MKDFNESSLGRMYIPIMYWYERSCRHTDYVVSYLRNLYSSDNSKEQFTNKYYVFIDDCEMFDTALEWTLPTQLEYLDMFNTFETIVDKLLEYRILAEFENHYQTNFIYALHNRIEKYTDVLKETLNYLVVSKIRDLLCVKDEWQVCAQPLVKGDVIINNLHDERCLWLGGRRIRYLYSIGRHRLKCLKHKIKDTLHNSLIIMAYENSLLLSRENKVNPKFAI